MNRQNLPPGNTPVTHFCQRLSRPQGQSAAGRIMSLKNSNDTIGNRFVAQYINHYATACPTNLQIQQIQNKLQFIVLYSLMRKLVYKVTIHYKLKCSIHQKRVTYFFLTVCRWSRLDHPVARLRCFSKRLDCPTFKIESPQGDVSRVTTFAYDTEWVENILFVHCNLWWYIEIT